MKNSAWRKFLRGASLQRDLEELRDVTLRYIRDETIAPLRGLGRLIAYGALGSVLVGSGAVLILLGTLRYLQWQFKVLDGTLSWIPYVIVALLALVILLLTAWRIMSGTAKRRLKVTK